MRAPRQGVAKRVRINWLCNPISAICQGLEKSRLCISEALSAKLGNPVQPFQNSPIMVALREK
jgi:hypothetical protein